MVARTLVNRDIEGGRRLVEELDRNKVPLRAAFWYLVEDRDRYQLVLATSVVDRDGPIKAYKEILAALGEVESEVRPQATDLTAVSPSDHLIKALRRLVKTGKGISEIRLSRNFVGDQYVEDALVYRLN